MARALPDISKDNAMALDRAAQLCAAAHDPRCRQEAGILMGWSASIMSQKLQALGQIWKAYRRQRPFWE